MSPKDQSALRLHVPRRSLAKAGPRPKLLIEYKKMKNWIFIHILAACAPFLVATPQKTSVNQNFPGWPAQHEGRALYELPLSERESNMMKSFPGELGKFSDGDRDLVFRWVTRPTRKLHPARDCYRASGYSIQPAQMRQDTEGNFWSCFQANHSQDKQLVCERLYDDKNQSFSDASAWYWAAVLQKSQGPWWNIVVSESL